MRGAPLQLGTDEPALRRRRFRGDTSPESIAAQHGCSLAAIALLFPFFVEDDFVTVLASAARQLSNADVLHGLNATSVRMPQSQEILLGLQLGRRRHTVYMERELMCHDEVLFCIEPPFEWVATSPGRLRAELGARLFDIPLR